ncbi:TetR/AcrR family transcriptional regulator [Subtercola endophyticus]|uniref:TetR/AcrR family transcriptional regulator n=1 Tax=Subtercola endophyticus TaxID=2895559 RepID=UPI001E574BFD|nr:TetR family transcriptional regulator [Subtercola endophyticus]UFS58768.1 TetR family transcriptional regulator [Subtercola endophyticus]
MPPYDRTKTTQRIFDAAVAEFAAEGIAGARVDRIAEAAEANKSLIYSYFGNKEELFAKVLQQRLTDLAEAVELHPERVGDYIGDLFDFMVANPDVLQLVQHETAHFSFDAIPHRAARTEHYADKVKAVADAQAVGAIDSTLDPRFVVMSLISLVSWFVAAPQITQMVMGTEVNDELRAQYRAHLVELARRALAPTPRP